MELRLRRLYPKAKYTIGKLYINGVAYCDTLEDPVRDFNKDGDLLDEGEEKVYADTAIPYGRYQVTITYSPKFKRDLPLLLGVKHFTYIRIHAGNTTRDTWGCILVGENTKLGELTNSRVYERQITAAIKRAIKSGDTVFITIT